MAEEQGKWVTINGTHVHIEKGETVDEAIGKLGKENYNKSNDYMKQGYTRNEAKEILDISNELKGGKSAYTTNKDIADKYAKNENKDHEYKVTEENGKFKIEEASEQQKPVQKKVNKPEVYQDLENAKGAVRDYKQALEVAEEYARKNPNSSNSARIEILKKDLAHYQSIVDKYEKPEAKKKNDKYESKYESSIDTLTSKGNFWEQKKTKSGDKVSFEIEPGKSYDDSKIIVTTNGKQTKSEKLDKDNFIKLYSFYESIK